MKRLDEQLRAADWQASGDGTLAEPIDQRILRFAAQTGFGEPSSQSVNAILGCHAVPIFGHPILKLLEPVRQFWEPFSRVVMSVIGTKRTSASALHMSAIGGKADIALALQNVRF